MEQQQHTITNKMDAGVGIGGHAKSVLKMTTSKLGYNQPIAIEEGVKKKIVVELNTSANLSAPGGQIEFPMVRDPDRFCDISSAILHGKVGIEFKHPNHGATWKSLATLNKDLKPDVGVVNNLYQSLFSNCIIKVNDFEVGDSSSNANPYTSFLHTLLSTSTAHANSHVLKELGFAKDDRVVIPADMAQLNSGGDYVTRRNMFRENRMVDFHIPLHNDLMTVHEYLPPNTKLCFVLKRSADAFVLWHNRAGQDDPYQFRIVLEDLKITLHMLEMEEAVVKAYNRSFGDIPIEKRPPQEFKITQNEFKTFAYPAQQTVIKQDNLFESSHLPDKLYVMLVEQTAFSGDADLNPYNFEFANMKTAYVKVNQDMVPNPPYKYAPGEDVNSCYRTFLENTGTGPFELESVNVSKEEWKNGGLCVFAFDRSPTCDNGLYNHLPTIGSLSLVIELSEPTVKNYMVLALACYDKKLVLVQDKATIEEIAAGRKK